MAKVIRAYDKFDEMEREAGSTDPNARANRPFILDGDYPPPDATLVSEPGGGTYTLTRDQFTEEQDRKREVARQDEDGHFGYPPAEQPRSPEQYAAELTRSAFRRAIEGGLPDAPGTAVAVPGGKPFKF